MESKVGFLKGLDQDSSVSKRDPNSYYDALNARIVTDVGLSTGSLTNEKGNKLLFRIPEQLLPIYTITTIPTGNTVYIETSSNTRSIGTSGGYASSVYNEIISDSDVATDITNGLYNVLLNGDTIYVVGLNDLISVTDDSYFTITEAVPTLSNPRIVGMGMMRDWLIVFTVSSTNSVNGQIWKCKYNKLTDLINDLDGEYLDPAVHLVYNNELGFNLNYRVGEVISRYQDSTHGKIFFIDGLNEMRHINVLDSESLALPLSALSTIPDIVYSQPKVIKTLQGGSYNSGAVQYTYQLFNAGGAESSFSPASGIIHLTASSDYSSNTSEYKGLPPETQSGKAVRVYVNNIDTRFEYIRLIAIYYTSQEAQPEINIVDEKAIPSSGSIYFTDDGNPTGVYTVTQYNDSGLTIFIPGTICTKNNYLIAGNIKEEYFDIDFDARVYRFGDPSGADANNFKLDGSTLPSSDVPNIEKTADAVLTRTEQDTWKYNVNTGTLGGYGANVEYEFILNQIKIEDDSDVNFIRTSLAAGTQNWGSLIDSTYQNNDSYTSYSSPINRAQLVGYTRDEIYAFGLVIFDEKGRQSFVKWIGDIKMPAIREVDTKITYYKDVVGPSDAQYDYATVFEDTVNGGVYANALGIKFTVNNIPAGYTYRIVRVRREESDKYILGQGLLGFTEERGTDEIAPYNHLSNFTYGSGVSAVSDDTITDYNGGTSYKEVVTFKSPEVLHIDSIQPINGDYIEVIGLTTEPIVTGEGVSYSAYYEGTPSFPDELYKITNITKIKNYDYEASKQTVQITDGIVIEDTYNVNQDFRYVINNGGTRSRLLNHANGIAANKGKCLALGLDSALTLVGGNQHVIANYTKDPAIIQYGGNTYTDRINRFYIACGNVTSSTTTNVYGGDTFICMWEYINSMMWTQDEFSEDVEREETSEILYIPLETTVNTELRHGSSFSRGNSIYKLCESVAFGNTIYPGEHNLWGVYPADLEDVYQYNTVYSVEPIGKTYTPQPLIFDNNTEKDYRIICSEQHINGQVADSWTKFYPANYLEVNSAYGPITKLITSRNQVFFFQDNAFGMVAFNERQLLKDNTGAELVLGTGDILANYRYISEKTGTKSKFGVVDTGGVVYFIDINNRKFMRFNGDSDECISDKTNMSSFFRSANYYNILTQDSTANKIGIHGVFDPVNKRVLYTMLSTGGINKTFSFNESMGAMESFYSFLPTIYENTDFGVVSVEPTNKQSCYVHNQGYRGVFYDVVYPTNITTTFSPNPDIKKVFTNLEFNSYVEYDILGTIEEIPTETISTIRLWNSFQDTGNIAVSHPTSLRRRFRTWRYQIPRRNSLRLMDYGLFTTMTFTNSLTDDKYFKLDDIIIHYLFPMI